MTEINKLIEFLDIMFGFYDDRVMIKDKDTAMLTEIKETVEQQSRPEKTVSGLADALEVFLDSEDSLTIHQCSDHILMAIKELRAKSSPSDDLIKEIIWIVKNFGSSPNAKLKIRTLLQGKG